MAKYQIGNVKFFYSTKDKAVDNPKHENYPSSSQGDKGFDEAWQLVGTTAASAEKQLNGLDITPILDDPDVIKLEAKDCVNKALNAAWPSTIEVDDASADYRATSGNGHEFTSKVARIDTFPRDNWKFLVPPTGKSTVYYIFIYYQIQAVLVNVQGQHATPAGSTSTDTPQAEARISRS